MRKARHITQEGYKKGLRASAPSATGHGGATKGRPTSQGSNGRGGPDAPTASFSIPRRGFLAIAGLVLVACGAGGGSSPTPEANAVAYRLSTRGLRASRASRANAANKRFVSRAAAEAGRAHPGDPARVVTIDVSRAQRDAWFGRGSTRVDLMQL